MKNYLLPLAAVLILVGCNPPAQPNFTLALGQNVLNVAQGNSVQVGLTLTPQSGLTGTVNLALLSPPTGVSLTPASVNISGSSPQSVTLTIITTNATPIQDHPLTLEASQGSLKKTVNFTLKVTGFTVSLNPTSATVNPGQSASTTLTITPQNGFSGTVNLSLQSPPEGVSLNPSSVSVSDSGAQDFTLEIQTTSATPIQTHSLTLQASQGNFSASARFELNVTAAPQPNFSVALSSTSATVVQGGSPASATLTITPQNGFSGTVDLSLQSPPAGVTVSPASVTVSGPNPQDFTVSFNTTAATPTGSRTLTLVATQGSLSKTASFELTVTSFNISLSRSSTMRAQGQGFSDFDLTLTLEGGFSGTVALSLQSPPSGISIGPASLTASGPVTLTVARTVPEGVYNLTVQAESGGLTRTAPLTLRVLRAATLAAGGYFSAAVKPNGEVWSWGDNTYGQLGRPTTGTSDSTPAWVSPTNDVVSLSLGEYHALALLQNGSVRAVGRDDFGQLGDGSTDSSSTNSSINLVTPSLPSDAKVVQVAAGRYHSLALLSDGTVYAWGRNNAGQLGDSTNIDRDTPVSVSALNDNDVIALAGGHFHSLALRSNGTVWAWGDNFNGQLGNGTNIFSYTPVQVLDITDAKAIAAGDLHSLALLNDGTVRSWGYNALGQLGNNTTTNANAPVVVSGLSSVREIAAGLDHNFAVLTDGSARAWGADASWQLGNGPDPYDDPSTDPKYQLTPVAVSGLPTAGPPPLQAVSLVGGFFHSLALLSDGSVMGWGNNDVGQIGNSSILPSNIPVVSAITGVQVPPVPAP